MESILRVLGIGWLRFISDNKRKFDLLLVIFSILELIFEVLNINYLIILKYAFNTDEIYFKHLNYDPLFYVIRIIKVLRIIRIIRLFYKIKKLDKIIKIGKFSLPFLSSLLILLLTMLTSFSLLS